MPIQNKDELKKHIQEYLRLKNIEQEYKNKINELKGSSDNIESNIVTYMNDNDFLLIMVNPPGQSLEIFSLPKII